jgi:hypothetical protein
MLVATLDSSVGSLEIEQEAMSRWLQPSRAWLALRFDLGPFSHVVPPPRPSRSQCAPGPLLPTCHAICYSRRRLRGKIIIFLPQAQTCRCWFSRGIRSVNVAKVSNFAI